MTSTAQARIRTRRSATRGGHAFLMEKRDGFDGQNGRCNGRFWSKTEFEKRTEDY